MICQSTQFWAHCWWWWPEVLIGMCDSSDTHWRLLFVWRCHIFFCHTRAEVQCATLDCNFGTLQSQVYKYSTIHNVKDCHQQLPAATQNSILCNHWHAHNTPLLAGLGSATSSATICPNTVWIWVFCKLKSWYKTWVLTTQNYYNGQILTLLHFSLIYTYITSFIFWQKIWFKENYYIFY